MASGGEALVGLVWLATSVAWLFLSLRLFLGSCAGGARDGRLDFISSRLAACLDASPAEVWAFVFIVQFQVLLLLTLWQRLLLRFGFVSHMRVLAVSCGSWFVVSMASVVEFRNDATARSEVLGFRETTLHNWAAAFAMTAFCAMHYCMWRSLRALSAFEEHALDRELAALESSARGLQASLEQLKLSLQQRSRRVRPIDFLYSELRVEDAREEWASYELSLVRYSWGDCGLFVLVVLFFAAWFASGDVPSAWRGVAVDIEWVVLAAGVLLHFYALRQSVRQLPDAGQAAEVSVASLVAARWRLLSPVCALLYSSSVFLFAPLSWADDPAILHTSPMFLVVMLSTYAYAAALLLPSI